MIAFRLALEVAALCFILPIALLMLMQAAAVGMDFGPESMLVVCVAGLIAFLAHMVVHELGHALAGWLVSMPPLSVTLVFVRIDWVGGRPALRPNGRLFELAAVAKICDADISPRRFAAVVVAGPLANVLVSGVCLAVAWTVNPAPPADIKPWRGPAVLRPRSETAAALNLVGFVGLSLAAMTLVPGRAYGQRSDGLQLLQLARGTWAAEPAAPTRPRLRTLTPNPCPGRESLP